MDKVKKNVGRNSLMIAIAREIKNKAKTIGKDGTAQASFSLWEDGEKVFLSIGNVLYTSNGGVEGIVDDSIDMSRQDCAYYVDKDLYRITIFSKPCKPFVMLKRILYKYAGMELEDHEVYDTLKESTNYLCYDEEECNRAIDFVRKTRGYSDTVEAKVDTLDELEHTSLNIRITTPKGKVKGVEMFYM